MNLPKIRTNKKRLGRGYGSGKGGHTSSRGQKGQKARTKVGILFEGLKMKKSFVKRLPFKRGKDKFKAGTKPVIVNLEDLKALAKSEKVVNVKTLVAAKIVDAKKATTFGVKVLGKGEIKDKLTFEIPVSKTASLKIEKAGGVIK